ncbi:MAG TPA: hypothetical protein VF124_04705 [Gaiellaceae bacterium]
MTSTSAYPELGLPDDALERTQDAVLLLDETEDWSLSEHSPEDPEPNAEGVFPGVPLS